MKRSQVTCPHCGFTRNVHTYRTKVEGYTGRCSKCYRREASAKSGKSRHFTGHKIRLWKTNAGRRGIPWELTNEYLDVLWDFQQGECALTGWPLNKETGNRQTAASLDRIDPTRGYVAGNVQFVVNIANIAKNNLTMKDFVRMARAVVDQCEWRNYGEETSSKVA